MAYKRDTLGGLLMDLENAEAAVTEAKIVLAKAQAEESRIRAQAIGELSRTQNTIATTAHYAWSLENGRLVKREYFNAWDLQIASPVEPDFPAVEPETNGHLIGHPLATQPIPPSSDIDAEMADAFAFPEVAVS